MLDALHADANVSAVSCQAETSTATALIELCEQQCGASPDVCGNSACSYRSLYAFALRVIGACRKQNWELARSFLYVLEHWRNTSHVTANVGDAQAYDGAGPSVLRTRSC